MALADTARLVATLELKDKFSKNAAGAERALGGLEQKTSTLGRVGGEVNRGLGNVVKNVKTIGLAAAGIIGSQVAIGLKSLADIEAVQAQTKATLESTGAVAGETFASITKRSQEWSLAIGKNEEDVQDLQNLLLTFTNITTDTFDEATEVALDMSQALGQDLKSSAIQLGKALNDPIRGVTALRRVGVSFTKDQEKQIKVLVESGRTLDAQRLILAELNKEFGGSARAFGETTAGRLERFKQAVQAGQRALATGFLPLLEKVTAKASELLADPAVIKRIESFGTSLAAGLDQVIAIGANLPWGAIGDAAKFMGTGARALLDAFTSLPPWVQTAVLTGWGLNKLTGGALGNIAGILTKSAFGALRGATPANPVFVADVAGGVGAGGGVAAAGRGLAGTVLKGLGAVIAGLVIGKEVGQFVAENLGSPFGGAFGPQKAAEEARVTAVLEGGNVDDMVGTLASINTQLATDDTGAQIALGVSRIPYIGDALGDVANTLEGQRDDLREHLSAMGYTNDQIDQMVAAALAGNQLTAAQSLAIVRESRDTSRHLDQGFDAQHRDQRDLIAATAAHKAVTERLKADAAASDRAMLTSIASVRAATERGESTVRTTASNTAAQLSRIESVERTTAGHTATVARKNFSPTLNFRADVLANISVSASQIARSLQIRTSASQTSFTGRGGDQRF